MSRGRGEDADVLEECASSSAVTPSTMQSHSSCSGPSGAEAASSSPFYSPRIQGLSELRSKFDNQLEFDVESSTSHWTEVSAATADSDDSDMQVPNSAVFEEMKKHPEWGPFFRRQPYELEIGAKIAEGGQAEIFEALGWNKYDSRCGKNKKIELVLKVFKKGFRLLDLQRMWPPGIASAAFPQRYFGSELRGDGLCWALGACLMDNERFAFIFDKYSGDLRKRIDNKMLKNQLSERSNGCPPFDGYTTYDIILEIAKGMRNLHKLGILHNDLKSSNVWVYNEWETSFAIGDFESSEGIKGTGFWRAPEVLQALRNQSLRHETFTEHTDVYSFAMTCYEIITGRIPFEGHDMRDYDIVLQGERPTLPKDYFCEPLNNLVRKCWHQAPDQRPSFLEIVKELVAMYPSSKPIYHEERKEWRWGWHELPM